MLSPALHRHKSPLLADHLLLSLIALARDATLVEAA